MYPAGHQGSLPLWLPHQEDTQVSHTHTLMASGTSVLLQHTITITDKGIENISKEIVLLLANNVLSRGPANDWFEALHPYLLYSSRIRRWFVDTVFVQHRERFCEYLLESPSAEVKLAISVVLHVMLCLLLCYSKVLNCHKYLV